MTNTIQVEQTGRQLEHDLKALSDTMTADNNGLILYVRDGEIALDTYGNLFTVTPLT